MEEWKNEKLAILDYDNHILTLTHFWSVDLTEMLFLVKKKNMLRRPLYMTRKHRMSCAVFKIDEMNKENKRELCTPIKLTRTASILVGDTYHKHLKSFQGGITSQSCKCEFYEEHMNAALRVLLGGRGICQILQDSVKIMKCVLYLLQSNEKTGSHSSPLLKADRRELCILE